MKNLPLKYQIFIIPLLAALVTVIVAVISARLVYNKIYQTHELQIKSVTEAVITMLTPIYDRVTAGELTQEEGQRLAKDQLRNIRFAGKEYFFTYDYDGKLLSHPIRTDLEGTYDLKSPTIDRLLAAARDGTGFVEYMWPKTAGAEPVAKLGYASVFKPWQWMIGTGVYIDDVTAETRVAVMVIGGVGLVALLVVLGIGLLIGRQLTARISGQIERMDVLADGNLDVTIPDRDGPDEISNIGKALEIFRRKLIESREATAAREVEQERRASDAERIAELTRSFDITAATALDAVSAQAENLERNSVNLMKSADLASGQAGTVSEAARRASENVQTVASAADELSSSILEIDRQVASSAKIVQTAIHEADRSLEHVNGLSEAAQRIGKVVNLITDVAGQTNLLALNATIEAARAGDAGKGFAVVAGEVKNLANQTARATDEISEQVAAIQAATRTAVDSINTFHETIGTIREVTAAIEDAVKEQGAATRKISSNVQMASDGTSQVSEAIGDVSSVVGSTHRDSEEVLAAAEKLKNECTRLRTQVQQFLQSIGS